MDIRSRWKRGAYQGPACPLCRRPLPYEEMSPGTQVCPHCRGFFEAVSFSPPETNIVVPRLGEAGPEGATSCVHHARNAAVATCDRCGSFICELCRVEVDGKGFCPGCFERLSSEGALESIVTRFPGHDAAAAWCAMLGLVFAPIFGPPAIYFGVRQLRWKKKMKESDSLGGAYIAIVLGVLEGIGFLVLLAYLVWSLASEGLG